MERSKEIGLLLNLMVNCVPLSLSKVQSKLARFHKKKTTKDFVIYFIDSFRFSEQFFIAAQ